MSVCGSFSLPHIRALSLSVIQCPAWFYVLLLYAIYVAETKSIERFTATKTIDFPHFYYPFSFTD